MLKPDRKHDTGIRILELLKLMLNDDLAKKDIMERLKNNSSFKSADTIEAYIKYFNTFDALGLHVERARRGYSLKNALTGVNLTAGEKKILVKLINSIKKLNNDNDEMILKNFFKKLNKYVNTDTISALNTAEKTAFRNVSETKAVLKTIIKEDSSIDIKYEKNGRIEELASVSPKQIVEEKGNCYVLVLKNTMLRKRKININSIISLKYSPHKSAAAEPKSTIIFELYNRPAKSYKLREWETLEDFGADFARIKNFQEDLETLLPRLLKYGENCRIIHPACVIEDFLALADGILSNLEDKECAVQH